MNTAEPETKKDYMDELIKLRLADTYIRKRLDEMNLHAKKQEDQILSLQRSEKTLLTQVEELKHSEHCHKEHSEKAGFNESTLKMELE